MKAAGWVLVFGSIFLLLPAQAFPSYSYVDLHPPGWIESRATCVKGRADVAGDGSGTSSIGSAGGGGCTTASTRTSRPSPTAWGNLLALFVPILFSLLLNRIGRRRGGSATPR